MCSNGDCRASAAAAAGAGLAWSNMLSYALDLFGDCEGGDKFGCGDEKGLFDCGLGKFGGDDMAWGACSNLVPFGWVSGLAPASSTGSRVKALGAGTAWSSTTSFEPVEGE